MKRSTPLIFLINLTIILLLYSTLNAQVLRNVPGEYPTIQAAIDSSADGDTVLVHPGTYEGNIDFKKKNLVVGSLFLTTQNEDYISQTELGGGYEIKIRDCDSNTVFSGFSIAGGLNGISCINSAASLNNLVIRSSHHGISISGSNINVNNVTLYSNSASLNEGGGISCINSELRITNSNISSNRSRRDGGGIYSWNSDISIYNTLITGNSIYGTNETDRGGGVFAYKTNMKIVNSTSTGNTSKYGSAFYFTDCDTVEIVNSIVYNNNISAKNSGITISYSNIEGGLESITNSGSTINWLDGNIDADPLFLGINEQEKGQYSLAENSPCINSGSPDTTGLSLPVLDLDGNPRIIDGQIDIGAYENQNRPGNFVLTVPGDYTTIQGAVNSAFDGDTVLVSPGTYNEFVDISGKSITLGSLYLTTGDSSYISNTKIDGYGLYPRDDIITAEGTECSGSKISGLTITRTDNDSGYSGIRVENADITMEYLVIRFMNAFDFGGGLYLINTESTVRNCTIKNNTALDGGGIFITGTKVPVIKNTVITLNTANFLGGGIYIDTKNVTLENIEISNNSAYAGGGICLGQFNGVNLFNVSVKNNTARLGGGGIFSDTSEVNISESEITGNRSEGYGGSMELRHSTVTIQNTIIDSNTSKGLGSGALLWGSNAELYNVVFTNNNSDTQGNPLYFIESDITGYNLTVCDNNPGSSEDGILFTDGIVSLTNSIIRNNAGNIRHVSPGELTISNSNIGGGSDGITVDKNTLTYDTLTNIDAEPMFIGTEGLEYVPGEGSPCIDTGLNYLYLPDTDAAGNPRVYNSLVDMGAYEWDPSLISTSILDDELNNREILPEDFQLYNNYPNPFNPVTTIRYDLPELSDITITVYNSLGQKVKTLVNHRIPPGIYSVKWDGTNEYGSRVSSGIYFYMLKSGRTVLMKKMLLIK